MSLPSIPHDEDDPYEGDSPDTYERVDCGERIEADSDPGECPEWGGRMQNISTPSERSGTYPMNATSD